MAWWHVTCFTLVVAYVLSGITTRLCLPAPGGVLLLPMGGFTWPAQERMISPSRRESAGKRSFPDNRGPASGTQSLAEEAQWLCS